MQDEFTHVDRAIEAIEHAMFEVSKAGGTLTGAKMYRVNRVWHELKRAADDLRSITSALPDNTKTL